MWLSSSFFVAPLQMLWSNIMCWTFSKSDGEFYLFYAPFLKHLLCFLLAYIFAYTQNLFRPCHNLVFTQVLEFVEIVLITPLGKFLRYDWCNVVYFSILTAKMLFILPQILEVRDAVIELWGIHSWNSIFSHPIQSYSPIFQSLRIFYLGSNIMLTLAHGWLATSAWKTRNLPSSRKHLL